MHRIRLSGGIWDWLAKLDSGERLAWRGRLDRDPSWEMLAPVADSRMHDRGFPEPTGPAAQPAALPIGPGSLLLTRRFHWPNGLVPVTEATFLVSKTTTRPAIGFCGRELRVAESENGFRSERVRPIPFLQPALTLVLPLSGLRDVSRLVAELALDPGGSPEAE